MVKDIIGFEGKYTISSIGEIFSIKSNKLLKNSTCNQGYPMAKLFISYDRITKKREYKYVRVHRLVATHYLPNPDELPMVNHLNGNKLDNSVANLEWCTARQNVHHAIATGLVIPKPKLLSAKQLATCRSNYIKGIPIKDMAKKYGISRLTIERWILDDSPEILTAKKIHLHIRSIQSGEKTAKRVRQLTMDGQFIKSWDSIQEAALAIGNRQGNISNVCAGRCKSSGGYKWEYSI